MKYETIWTIKETEKATVVLAAVEGIEGPVIVKRLKGANVNIYRFLCSTQNPYIPHIFEVEEQGEEVCIVEEYIAGETLEEAMKQGQYTDEEKLKLAWQLCEAVEFLHTCNPPVIHRDIKPSNILINKKQILKVIDFDASRYYKEEMSGDTRLLGTVEYAPPEQFGYAQTDVRSDIYSIGAVFNEMMLSNHYIAKKWKRIIKKCTHFAPEYRYQSVRVLKKEITYLLSYEKYRRTRTLVSILAGVLVVGMVFTGIREGMFEKETKKAISELQTPSEAMLPTATNTLSPTVLPEETKEQDLVSSLEEEVAQALSEKSSSVDLVYNDAGDYMLYSSYFETWERVGVQFTNMITGDSVRLNENDFIFENSIIIISKDFMNTLQKTYYDITIFDSLQGTNPLMKMACKLYNEERPEYIDSNLEGNELLMEYPEQDTLHTILRNDSKCKITGLETYWHTEVEPDFYKILYEGKAIEFSGELLQQYVETGFAEFYILLDDGTKEKLRIEIP